LKFITLYMGITRLRDKCFATRNIVELMIKKMEEEDYKF